MSPLPATVEQQGEILRQDAEGVLAGIRVKDPTGTMLVIPRVVTIVDVEQKAKAAGLRSILAEAIVRVNDLFDPEIKARYDEWKAAIGRKKAVTGDMEAAVLAIDAGMGAFDDAEEERQRKAAADEAARLKKAQDAVAGEKKEREDLAREAEAGGDHALAADLRQTPVAAVPDILPQIQPGTAKVAGLGERKNYSAEVEGEEPIVQFRAGFRQLVGAVASGAVSYEALEPCETYLNALARKVKQVGVAVCPGVKCVAARSYNKARGGRG